MSYEPVFFVTGLGKELRSGFRFVMERLANDGRNGFNVVIAEKVFAAASEPDDDESAVENFSAVWKTLRVAGPLTLVESLRFLVFRA